MTFLELRLNETLQEQAAKEKGSARENEKYESGAETVIGHEKEVEGPKKLCSKE